MLNKLLHNICPGNTVEKPIIIVGTGRCGTTILFQLMRSHPDLVPTTGYPDGEDHVGWVKYGKCIISGLGLGDNLEQHGWVGHTFCLAMDESFCTEDTVKSMHEYYAQEVLKDHRGKRVINKCPHLSNKLGYVLKIFPTAKIVHIVRDCVPVVASWVKIMEVQDRLVLNLPHGDNSCFSVAEAPKWGDRNEIFKNEPRYYPGGGIDILAEYWERTNTMIPLQMKGKESQLITLRYEDLVQEPLKELNRIFSLCELDPINELPLEIHKDNNRKYLDVLTKEQITRFNDITKKTRSQFGYI